VSGFKGRVCAGLLTLCACALSPAQAFADSPDAGADSPSWLAHRGTGAVEPEARPSTGPVMVRSLAAIALLAGLGATALFLKKRRGGLLAPVVRNDFRINVLGSTRVGPKAHAVVASVAGRVLLLGVTDNAVQKLAWLDGGPALDEDEELEGSFDSRGNVGVTNAKAPTPAASRMATDEPPERPELAPRRSKALPTAAGAAAPTGTFRDLLSRFTKQEEQREKSGLSSPAAILAESTQDVYDGRPGGRGRTANGAELRAVRAVGSAERSLAPAGRALEGQAKGLAALLQNKVV
jgi:flagellar biogenesis protein FliO